MFCSSNADWCELLRSVWAAGGRLSLSAQQLRVDGASVLSAQQVEQIRDNKAELVAMLERSQDLRCPHCSAQQIAVRTFDGFENLECFECGRCSGCRRSTG